MASTKFQSVGNETLRRFENKKKSAAAQAPQLTRKHKMSWTFSADPALVKEIQEVKGKSAFIVHGEDDRQPVLKVVYPFTVICLLEIETFDGEIMEATGFFISRKCVLTAGHCVFERGKWVKKVKVTPGAQGSFEPFSSAVATRFRSVSGWSDLSDDNFDYGAIILDDDLLFQRMGASLGAKVYEGEKQLLIAGYPEEKSGFPWMAEGPVIRKSGYKLWYDVDTERGNSGSPIIVQVGNGFYVIGLHTEGANPNKGIYLQQQMMDRISEWVKL